MIAIKKRLSLWNQFQLRKIHCAPLISACLNFPIRRSASEMLQKARVILSFVQQFKFLAERNERAQVLNQKKKTASISQLKFVHSSLWSFKNSATFTWTKVSTRRVKSLAIKKMKTKFVEKVLRARKKSLMESKVRTDRFRTQKRSCICSRAMSGRVVSRWPMPLGTVGSFWRQLWPFSSAFFACTLSTSCSNARPKWKKRTSLNRGPTMPKPLSCVSQAAATKNGKSWRRQWRPFAISSSVWRSSDSAAFICCLLEQIWNKSWTFMDFSWIWTLSSCWSWFRSGCLLWSPTWSCWVRFTRVNRLFVYFWLRNFPMTLVILRNPSCDEFFTFKNVFRRFAFIVLFLLLS